MTASSPPFDRLVLASGSPRRRQLLAEHGYRFTVIEPADGAECGICSGESPAEMAARLALQKAADVARRFEEGVYLGADTLVECCGQVLGKPRDRDDARQILMLLRDRLHHVYSGVCLWRRPDDTTLVRVDRTSLRMDRFSDKALDSYLETELWEGKAGAFGYQDGLDWVHITTGSESNVVGLPMELVDRMLTEFAPSLLPEGRQANR